MIKKIIDFIDNPDDLIELYCGVGTFTIPLSFVFNNILATENNRVSIKCLELGVKENKINRCSGELSLHVLEIMQSILKSAKIDEKVYLESVTNIPQSFLDTENVKFLK